jgi:hypothetical protein
LSQSSKIWATSSKIIESKFKDEKSIRAQKYKQNLSKILVRFNNLKVFLMYLQRRMFVALKGA